MSFASYAPTRGLQALRAGLEDIAVCALRGGVEDHELAERYSS